MTPWVSASAGCQIRVGVFFGCEAVAVFQVGLDHVGFHGSGAEEGDVDDEVVEFSGGELADEFALSRGFDLEAAQGVGGADELEGGFVVERDQCEVDGSVGFDVVRDLSVLPSPVASCLGDGLCVGVEALDFFQGVGDGRLHAHPQHVELEHAHGVHVVLVELAHGQGQPAGFHGGAVAQVCVGEDDAAGVHGDVAGQPVEAFGEVHEQVELFFGAEAVGEGGEFGFFFQGFAEG